MQGATTDGTTFLNPVIGVLAYNQLGHFSETGLPTSASTTIAPGASVPVSVKVTNTTNHVGYFELAPTGNDITEATPPRRWSWRPEPPGR